MAPFSCQCEHEVSYLSIFFSLLELTIFKVTSSVSNVDEGEVKNLPARPEGCHRTCFLRKSGLKEFQFHLPFHKGRQDTGQIKKKIYIAGRKLEVAAGGSNAAGRRGEQECLVRSHSRGKPEQSQRCWARQLQLLLSSESHC